MNEKEFQIYRERAEGFLERLKNEFFYETVDLQAEVFHSVDPVPWAKRLEGSYVPAVEGDCWGGLWESAWFHITGKVPEAWAGEPVWFKLELGGEILIFDDGGVPFCGLTNTSVFAANYRKNLLEFTPKARGGETVDFYAEVGGNGLLGDEITPGTDWRCEVGDIRHLKMGRFNVEAWNLANDFEVLLSLLRTLPEKSYRAVQLNMALNEAVSAYADDPANAAAARSCVAPQLAMRATDSALSTAAVGHAHIDTGWLWPVRETIRKCARTFSSQLYNLERYPDYVFGASQPQLYAFVKEHYPELYAKIREAVKSGRWELQGGMWVEADCNIISGESMVRQFLAGKNFYMDEFGMDVRNLWLPDVFGYSAAMPQIIRKAGCDWFLTQKISWSQFNKFPYHTFHWRGIDGTEVLTHFPPEDNYNSALKPEQLNYAVNNFNENYFLPEFITLFGVGDGGGGPRPEHIEHGLRTADLEGCPQVRFDRADAFFARLAEHAGELPEWAGELYLELHRGTLTTQARTKRNNRKCEQMLAQTEFICSVLPAADYPAETLDRLWKVLLINQFHDIIPGSSIRKVYEVTEAEHAMILAECENLVRSAAAKLTAPDGDALTVVNTLSYDYTGAVALPEEWASRRITDGAGRELLTQAGENGVWVLGEFPPQSVTTLYRGEAVEAFPPEADDSLVLENDLVRYEFDADARLVAAFDKTTGRDVVAGAAANLLALYVDQPNKWDAWDVDFTYVDTPPAYAKGGKAFRSESGPVRQALTFELTVGRSAIRQQVVLTENSKRLDFNTEVDWKERHRMLRVAFPTTVRAEEAYCDIQYGFVRRTTARNTSWDFARFEVAAHRYVDISDACGGAALLNDSKYGYRLDAGTLDLNLLRSPTYPDSEADQGTHFFTYSFLPHAGGLCGSEVMQEAACLNRAPAVLPGKGTFALPCRVAGGEGVSLEVVKKAEKSDALVIRVVETDGRRSTAVLDFARGTKLVETNLLEWTEEGELPIVDGSVELTLRPFEIRTFLVR